MNNLSFIYFMALIISVSASAHNWQTNTSTDGVFSTLEARALKKPLIIINAKKGFIACGYINVEACNKTGEACAIVSGVNNGEEVLKAKIENVSNTAQKIGIKVGMTGKEALALLK